MIIVAPGAFCCLFALHVIQDEKIYPTANNPFVCWEIITDKPA